MSRLERIHAIAVANGSTSGRYSEDETARFAAARVKDHRHYRADAAGVDACDRMLYDSLLNNSHVVGEPCCLTSFGSVIAQCLPAMSRAGNRPVSTVTVRSPTHTFTVPLLLLMHYSHSYKKNVLYGDGVAIDVPFDVTAYAADRFTRQLQVGNAFCGLAMPATLDDVESYIRLVRYMDVRQ